MTFVLYLMNNSKNDINDHDLKDDVGQFEDRDIYNDLDDGFFRA